MRKLDYTSISSPLLFSFSDKYIDQKKKTTLRNNTRKIGGQNPMFTTVAGSHNFQLASIVSV